MYAETTVHVVQWLAQAALHVHFVFVGGGPFPREPSKLGASGNGEGRVAFFEILCWGPQLQPATVEIPTSGLGIVFPTHAISVFVMSTRHPLVLTLDVVYLPRTLVSSLLPSYLPLSSLRLVVFVQSFLQPEPSLESTIIVIIARQLRYS